MGSVQDLGTLGYFELSMSDSLRTYYEVWNAYNAQLDEAIQAENADEIRRVRQLIKSVKAKIRARGGAV